MNRTTHNGFIQALLERPDDWPTYLIFADFLDENDLADTANTYRWMGNRKHRPWHRADLKKPTFCWVRESLERKRKRKVQTLRERAAKVCPQAVLHRALFLWPPDAPSSGGFIQFGTWGAAVSWLQVRLKAYWDILSINPREANR